MARRLILFFSPIAILIEILLLNWIVDMVRQPSDVAVAAGIILLCVDIILNFFFFSFIQKQFKQTK